MGKGISAKSYFLSQRQTNGCAVWKRGPDRMSGEPTVW